MTEDVTRLRAEAQLNEEFDSTIPDRVTRYLELNFAKIIPNTHFAAVSAECLKLYRDGYFYACIALCQSVAEAIVRFLCQCSGFKARKDFEKNLQVLRTRGIKPDCIGQLETVWEDRHDFHHLNPEVPTDRTTLQNAAKDKLKAICAIETEVFAVEMLGGGMRPKYPKYWPKTLNENYDVFLRFEP